MTQDHLYHALLIAEFRESAVSCPAPSRVRALPWPAQRFAATIVLRPGFRAAGEQGMEFRVFDRLDRNAVSVLRGVVA
jgi:hypothetical protein